MTARPAPDAGTPCPPELIAQLERKGYRLHETRIGFVLTAQGGRLFCNDLEGVRRAADALRRARKKKPAGVRA